MAPADAGTPYLSMLRSGLREVASAQEIHYANHERYAESLERLLETGWEGYTPAVPGNGEYRLETVSESERVAVQGSYSGAPDVLCYLSHGEEIAALPRPAWWDPTATSPSGQCTPGAPAETAESAVGGKLAYWAWPSCVLVGLLSVVVVVAGVGAEVLARTQGPDAAAFVDRLGQARAWSVLWIVGLMIWVAFVPW